MLDIVKSFPSCNGNGAVAAPTMGAASVDVHVESINILLPRLKQITADLEAEIGGHIAAIKAAEPNDWEAIVKTRCGISRSRAYELMAIADGTKTVEQTRHETNARQVRFRQNQAVRYVTDEKTSATIDTQIVDELRLAHKRELAQRDELEEGYKRQITRFEAEIARLSDAESLNSRHDVLLAALKQIDELLSEVRGLSEHYVQNRQSIGRKIIKAKTLAASAVKAAAGKSTNSAMKIAA
jgi:hypothetical protein